MWEDLGLFFARRWNICFCCFIRYVLFLSSFFFFFLFPFLFSLLFSLFFFVSLVCYSFHFFLFLVSHSVFGYLLLIVITGILRMYKKELKAMDMEACKKLLSNLPTVLLLLLIIFNWSVLIYCYLFYIFDCLFLILFFI